MNALEKVRKIRESYLTHDSFYKATNVFVMGEDEAAVLLTDEPSKTAEELVQQIWDECVTSPGAYVEFDNYGPAKLIQSALTQAKAETRREAYKDFNAEWAKWVSETDEDMLNAFDAAILGHGEEKP